MNLKMLSFVLIALLLAACGTVAGTPTPLPTVALGGGSAAPQTSFGGGVTASGSLVPAQEARLAFALAGEVETVNVGVGDQVQAGQVLARLAGNEKMTAAVESANLEVLNAQQALKDLQDSAAMSAAQAQLAVAQAQTDVANARKKLDDAQRRLKNLNYPDLEWYQDQIDKAHDALLTAQENTEIIDIGSLQAALQVARDVQDKLQERLDKVKAAVKACAACDAKGSFTVDGIPQTLDEAQDNYNGAVNRVRELELQIAQAKRGNSQAIEEAQKAYDEAVKNLASAQRGPKPLDVEVAEGNVAVAEANMAVAQAALAEAQAHFARVRAGPDPDQLALARARLTAAEAQLAAAKSALEDLELRAPFSGTVTELYIHEGEWVTPGQPLVLLSDLQHIRVETTDLSERDVPKVEVGQLVTVLIKALNEEATGHVSEIAPLAETLGGDVVYKTTIALDALPAGLRAGMSVEVQIATGQ
jgi:multidrug efflux pump subunit AcrA (membrane-fusion protein)